MNIRVIYYKSIYDRNGVAKVIRSFAENEQPFFAYTGHNVVVFDNSWTEAHSVAKEGSWETASEANVNVLLLKSLKRRIKSCLGVTAIEKYARLHAIVKEKYDKSYWGAKKMDREKILDRIWEKCH